MITLTENTRLNFAWFHPLGHGTFSAGASIDRVKFKVDFSTFYVNPIISHTTITANSGIGLAYHSSPRNFYIGISSNYLIPHILYLPLDPVRIEYYDFRRDYYLMSGMDIKLSATIKLIPSILIWRNYETGICTNLLTEFKNKYQFGINYKSIAEQAGFRIGYKTKGMCINYNFIMILTRLNTIQQEGHNLSISYAFDRN